MTRRSSASVSSDVASKGHLLYSYSSRFSSSSSLLCSDPLIHDKVRRERKIPLFLNTHIYNTCIDADKLTFRPLLWICWYIRSNDASYSYICTCISVRTHRSILRPKFCRIKPQLTHIFSSLLRFFCLFCSYLRGHTCIIIRLVLWRFSFSICSFLLQLYGSK